ncbi:MAG: ABC transporter permease [Candidatus Altiarchaeota archaeon]|nr:ABC transporter permease [Candidatus Altiarchaeota archaeon]
MVSYNKLGNMVIKFIFHRKLRSFLTTIGIAIGVALIFSLISINQGMLNVITESIDEVGGSIVTIVPKLGPGAAGAFSKEEIAAVKKLASVKDAAGIYATILPISIRGGKDEYLPVYGYQAGALNAIVDEIQSFKVGRGRFIEDDDTHKVMIGYLIADENNLGPGGIMEIGGVDFRVVGVLEEIGNRDDDSSINVNSKDVFEITGEDEQYHFIMAKVFEPDEDRIKRAIERVRGRDDFDVFTPEGIMESINSVLSILNAVFVGIGTISIIVGSIGVANTMYMAVFERTREIGIMKAIGAKERDILLIFILESGLLSLVGGLVGIVFGFLLALGIAKAASIGLGLTNLKAGFDFNLFLFSMGLSFMVGILSGFFPARYASKLEPVQALRYE